MLRITEENRRWWTLAGGCMGLFVLMLDSTVVTLALPSVQQDLQATTGEQQWVLNAYLLATAVLVVTAGRLGDMFGRKRIFLTGLTVFTAGLVVSATAPSVDVLILGRVVQGIGAAGMLTLSLALVSEAFSEDERPRALGIWAAVSSLALTIGPLVGGVIVDALSWRWIFWVSVPPLLVGFVLTSRAARESSDAAAGHRLDVPGVVALTVGVTGVVLALVQGHAWGWGSTATLLAAAVGILGLVAFALIEPRVRQPVVEFALFRNRPYLGASAAAVGLLGAFWGVLFFMPAYLQQVLGYSPSAAGVLMLPITIPMAAISPFAGRLVARFGPRVLMTLGMVCATAGVALMTRLTATSGYATVLPGFLLFGIALGVVYAPMSTAAMAAMPHAKAGIASGVLAMTRVLAGTIVLAAMGALYAGLRADRLDAFGGAEGHDANVASAYALSRSLWIPVALCVVGTAFTWLLVRGPGETAPPAPVPVEPARATLAVEPARRA